MENTNENQPKPDIGDTKYVWNQHDDYKEIILNNNHLKIILPSLDLITQDTQTIKQHNSFKKLPSPSIDLFEFIGKHDKFIESVEQSYFAEILVLLFPSISNSSVLFFQKNLNSLILSKNDLNFTNEYMITRSKEPCNLPQINASLGALHYFYLLYYEWLISLKDANNSIEYENHTKLFFDTYLKSLDIVIKFELAKQLKYTSNLFFQKSKAQEIYSDILTIGYYLKDFIESKQKINSHIFRTRFEDYETEYLKLVKIFILDGKENLGKNDDFKITTEQISKIINSLLLDNFKIPTEKGLWSHHNEINTFIAYIKRYHLLKKIHNQQNVKDIIETNNEEDGDNESDTGGEQGSVNQLNPVQTKHGSRKNINKNCKSRKKI